MRDVSGLKASITERCWMFVFETESKVWTGFIWRKALGCAVNTGLPAEVVAYLMKLRLPAAAGYACSCDISGHISWDGW
jgi:hypothetical protein